MRRAGLWAGALLASTSLAEAAETSRFIAVIYPDIGEPFRSVFTKIIEGIEEQARGRIVTYPISASANLQDLSAELRRQDIRVVIALGRNGLKAASTLDREVGVVAGGVLSVPESELRGFAVHSLAPDPALLFGQLKSLLPSARRVLVAHDPLQNGWLIRRAREAAKTLGLELAAQESEDLKAALRFYQEALASADAKRDVLWLPQDSVTVDESAVLPLVLQEAWNRNMAIFSSSVSHVKRGALFSLFPNNVALGRSLATSALGYLTSGAHVTRGLQPLKDVLVAVNLRTANHLGLNLAGRQQQFDLVFPES
jgi:putative ABC transport system substrate-binding protein